ncbi:MAG: CaiB/BaiF CoA transferase family protein [Candidatus Geothermincolia bacterium]
MRSMLDGVRIIDFTNTVAGPGCTFFMADMGAEVIKIERPGRGDDARWFPPYKDGVSASFTTLNHGKRGATIDLAKPEGVAVFKELVKGSDVLVENYTPGVMKRFGVDYESLKEINPKLVMCSISGYGQFGPLSPLPGYDAVIQAMSGLMSVTGFADGPPLRAGTLIVDISTAFCAAFSVCAALFARERTGEGEHLDVAMYDVAINLLEAQFVNYTVNGTTGQRTGNRYVYVTPFDTFQSKDSYLLIICAGDGPFENLCKAMGQPELAADERFKEVMSRNANEPELKQLIEAWTKQFTNEELLGKLIPAGVPAAPVMDVKQVFENPHTAARNMIVDVKQGDTTITTFGPAIKATNSEVKIRGGAPGLGEHNDWLLRDVLGKSDDEVQAILASGAMG